MDGVRQASPHLLRLTGRTGLSKAQSRTAATGLWQAPSPVGYWLSRQPFFATLCATLPTALYRCSVAPSSLLRGSCQESAEVLTNISRRPFFAEQPNLQIVVVLAQVSNPDPWDWRLRACSVTECQRVPGSAKAAQVYDA